MTSRSTYTKQNKTKQLTDSKYKDPKEKMREKKRNEFLIYVDFSHLVYEKQYSIWDSGIITYGRFLEFR